MPITGIHKPKREEDAVTKPVAVSNFVAKFIQKILDGKQLKSTPSADVPVIRVSNAVSGAAHLYERLRYSVDYHEEHVLRRHALARILKRRFESLNGVTDSARSLLVELIHAGYLKNEAIPESIAIDVQAVLDRYVALFEAIRISPCRDKNALIDWFTGVAAAELDEKLVPHPSESALIDLVVAHVQLDNPLRDWHLGVEEMRSQLLISSYRALYVLDLPKLHYILLRERMPHWHTSAVDSMVAMLPTLLRHHQFIEAAMQHTAGEQLYRIIKRRSLVFHVLHDIVTSSDTPSLLLTDEKKLTIEIEATCERYYKAEKARLWQSALRATFYILLTKVVIALAIEAPIEYAIYGDDVPLAPLFVNVFFPPVLMFLLTATTRFPGGQNTSAVIQTLMSVVSGDGQRVFPHAIPAARSSAVSSWFLSLIYLVMFIVTFGAISIALGRVGFNFISLGFFLFFLSVVSFFAIRIRQPVRDLFVISRRDNIFIALIEFFSLPILKVGRWISLTSSRFNVILYLFDYFLEAPVKSFLLVTEDVLGFFRQKREDIL